MLSPSLRQVAHALLTRPPLSSCSINRSLNHKIPVRLECVMHAASVYPEPGSNSLKNCILTEPQSDQHHLLELIFCSFTFGIVFSTISELTRFHILSLYISSSLLFDFQCPSPPLGSTSQVLPSRQLCYSTTCFPFCQHLFLKKLKKFYRR